jgi:hypothetical protein
MISTPYNPPKPRGRRRQASRLAGARYATAATAAFFLVAGISGILLFFHVGGPLFTRCTNGSRGVHRATALHLVRNRQGLVKVARTTRARALFGLAGVIAAGFLRHRPARPRQPGGRAGARRRDGADRRHPPVLGVSVEDLAVRLRGTGVDVGGADQTLAELAATRAWPAPPAGRRRAPVVRP